jgi:hypothetical protein
MKFSKWLRAIANIGKDRMKVFALPAAEPDPDNPDANEKEPGLNWILCVYRYKTTFRFNMSSMTEPELIKLKEMFDFCYENALPVVKLRDQQAKESADNGEDIFERRYRAAPRVSYLPGESE